MNLEKNTALALRVGIVIGALLMIFGLIVSMNGGDETILHAGVSILILSPFLGILTSFVCLLAEKDHYWAMIAGILLLITIAGMVFHI